MTPEAKSRQTIDALLEQAGWHVCDMAQAMLVKDSTVAEMGMLVRQLERAGIVTIAGDQGKYWPTEGGAAA